MHVNLTWNCRVCGVVFLFGMRMLAKPYHFGVNWPTTHCEIKDGVHFFTLKFECYIRYNKLLLCNSENSEIVWWNKNNSDWGFSVFFEKRTKSCLLKKTKKLWVVFSWKKRVFLNLAKQWMVPLFAQASNTFITSQMYQKWSGNVIPGNTVEGTGLSMNYRTKQDTDR